jgi:hypothetical protein
MSNLTDTLSRLRELLIDQTIDTEAAALSAELYHEIERAVQESVEQTQAQEILDRIEAARELGMLAAREAQREPDRAPMSEDK